MTCYNCGKENIEKWSVKFRDENGELHFKVCCSTNCCDKIKIKYAKIHMDRYDDTIYQSYQKCK